MYSPLEQFNVIALYFYYSILDLSLQNIVIPFLGCLIVVQSIIYFFTNNVKVVPEVWQLFFEYLLRFLISLLLQQIGVKSLVYLPFFFSIFNFILFCNLLSLTPFSVALTSHLILILLVSLSSCLFIFLFGIYINNLIFFKIFVPQCPFFLMPFLVLIEILSYIIRSVSLALRLSANIMAGHTLVYIISSSVLNLLFINFFIFFFNLFFLLLVFILEFGVGFLQAYVFTILLSIYLNDCINFKSH